jgi:hypothetical protein
VGSFGSGFGHFSVCVCGGYGGWDKAFGEITFKALAFGAFIGNSILKELEAFFCGIRGELDLFVDDGSDCFG